MFLYRTSLIIPELFLILVNNLKQPLHVRNSFTNQISWKRMIKKFFKSWLYLPLELHVIRMSPVCHPYVTPIYSYVIRMYSYVIRMSLVCTRMSSVCTRMSSACHSYVLVCHLYVTRMYSYIIRVSLVCTRISSVCYSYVLVCHSYVTCLWFSHEPLIVTQRTNTSLRPTTETLKKGVKYVQS